jgi:hypothetical protein
MTGKVAERVSTHLGAQASHLVLVRVEVGAGGMEDGQLVRLGAAPPPSPLCTPGRGCRAPTGAISELGDPITVPPVIARIVVGIGVSFLAALLACLPVFSLLCVLLADFTLET